MIHVTIFILLLTSSAELARDSVADTCDFKKGEAQCGDVCIKVYRGHPCICEEKEERLNLWSGEKYYCVEPSLDNKTQCTIDTDARDHCPQG